MNYTLQGMWNQTNIKPPPTNGMSASGGQIGATPKNNSTPRPPAAPAGGDTLRGIWGNQKESGNQGGLPSLTDMSKQSVAAPLSNIGVTAAQEPRAQSGPAQLQATSITNPQGQQSGAEAGNMGAYLNTLGFDPATGTDKHGRTEEQIYRDTIFYGANAPTEEERRSLRLQAERWLNAKYPPQPAPPTNGMGQNGMQVGQTPQAPVDVPSNYQPPGGGQQGGNPPVGGGSNPAPQPTDYPGTGSGGGQQPQSGYPYVDPATGEPANANQGQGGTSFNPGGGTNPDGTNPTVPQGNQSNGTSPSVYTLLDDIRQSPAVVGESQYATFRNDISGNGTYYENHNDAGKARMLNTLHEGLRSGEIDWNTVQNQWGLKEAYLEAFGDPMQGVSGAAANTVNENGSVQGQYQTDTGGSFQAISSDAAGMDDMDVQTAEAAAAAQNQRDLTPEEQAAIRVNNIMSQDSPLMMLARQDGVDFANQAGLRNSSLAAGASMREMARAATPIAMQDAQTTAQMESQNQLLESDRLEQNAGRGQQANLFNAESENAATAQEFQTEAQRREQNAGRQTQTGITNAGMANDMTLADRQREMQYNLQQLAGDQDYAKSGLIAAGAADLANIEGQYKTLISENDTAARMFDSYYQSVAQVVGNDKIFADEASEKVNYLKGALESVLNTLLAFDDFELPSAGSTGSGEGSNFQGGGTQPAGDFDFGNFNF